MTHWSKSGCHQPVAHDHFILNLNPLLLRYAVYSAAARIVSRAYFPAAQETQFFLFLMTTFRHSEAAAS
jgi:hypothetical protein